MMRHEIVLSGYGGQGIVLGGIILAEAAAIYDDRYATHNQSYGPEARGGSSKSEVILSDAAIHFPEIDFPDILIALTKEAANKFLPSVKEGGILIVDARIKGINVPENIKLFCLPIADTAITVAGSEIVTNIVTLGAFMAITKAVSDKALTAAIIARVPKGTAELNIKAMWAGYDLVEKAGA